jgi:hypothetical protein
MRQMMNQPVIDAGLETRLRTMRFLWVMWLATIGLFTIVSYASRPPGGWRRWDAGEHPTLLYGLAAAGFSTAVVSFVVKRIFFKRAAEAGQPAQAQTGFILALVLCEASALFGLVGLFATHDSSAYALFALGALGMVLHFPARGPLEAAYHKPGV